MHTLLIWIVTYELGHVICSLIYIAKLVATNHEI
uniref:Uncharacterized protein n=1 Tax=Rhizophora mucronata TaxID=61149 RepID=A0A2P2R0G8_RHIMU